MPTNHYLEVGSDIQFTRCDFFHTCMIQLTARCRMAIHEGEYSLRIVRLVLRKLIGILHHGSKVSYIVTG